MLDYLLHIVFWANSFNMKHIQIQTPGGAFWQRDTVCTIAIFQPYEPIYGNGDIAYSSRKHTPDGAFNNASGDVYKNR